MDNIFRGAWKRAILELCRRFLTFNFKLMSNLEGQYSPGSCDLNSKNAHGDKCSKCSNTTEKPEIFFREPVHYNIADIFCTGVSPLHFVEICFVKQVAKLVGTLLAENPQK